jgi:16S rRNA (uracil1498-N3)-methyltransferase
VRVSRHYIDAPLQAGSEICLPDDIAHYLSKVLRLPVGAELTVFNGVDGEFSAHLLKASKQETVLMVDALLLTQSRPALRLELGLGLSRGDRMDYGIQKSTELGVSSITPIYAERGEVVIKQVERLENKLRHWRKVAIAACEQSGRLDLPEVREPMTLAQWLESKPAALNLLLDPSGSESMANLPAADAISLLSGPEGGFTEAEVQAAAGAGLQLVKLGPRVLRTETAPVAALAILQHLYGDLS